MIQIMGEHLEFAFKHYGITAELKFQAQENHIGEALQVWELTDEEYSKLLDIEDWGSQEFGFYSWWVNGGCNHSIEDTATTTISNLPLKVFTQEFDKDTISWGYVSLSDYLESHLGITVPHNIAYYVESLSELNGMTKADFMKKYW